MFPADFPPDDLEFVPGLPFGRHGQSLDLLRLRARSARPAPAILHLHGGAWVRFGRWAPANVFLARAGFVTVSADYRLAPGAIFPAQLGDVGEAVTWLRANAGAWQLDPARLGAWGVSAGAHLAALLGTGAGTRGEPAVQAVGNVSGPMDLFDPALSFGPEPFPLLGGPWAERQALAAQASPVRHVSGRSAPFLHLHGLHDDEVPVSQARRMHAALRAAGVPSELALLDGGHYVNDTHRAEIEARLLDFFRRELGH